jgi:hypothetical protein
MKATTVLTILVLGLGLVWPAGLAEAAPMTTAFTYQGRLTDPNGDPCHGQYDFQFKLYDANSDGNQIGTDVNRPNVDVIESYFTVDVDFGYDVFGGNDRWVEIGVRPGEQDDPCAYTTLSPRQQVTPAPYAIYAKNTGWIISDSNMYSAVSGNVGIGTSSPSHKLNVIGDANITGSLYAGTGSTVLFVDDTTGRVGIGTTSPNAKVTINDNITGVMPGVPGLMIGNNGNSAIWVGKDSDNYGAFEWIDPYVRIWSENEVRFALGGQQDKIVFDSSGNVGIGTPGPSYKLEVNGSLYAQTVDTGQGNYELYAMNQNVRTSDNTTFNRVHIADYGTALGGFHVGSTSDPGTDNLRVDGQVYIPNMDNATVATAYEVLWQSDKLVKGNISSSSARYKQDIRPLRDDFDRILQAQCRSFTFRENGQEAIGFIAEEFDALGLNNLVIYRDARPDGIKYDMVPLYLLEVLKDQAQTTEQLKAENQSLTERVEALERTVQQLVRMKEVQL